MIQVAVYTDIGGRDENEDTIRYVQDGGKLGLAVADGLGGHGGGRTASETAADTVCNAWNGSTDADEVASLVQTAHKKICNLQDASCQMKSTIVFLALDGKNAAWVHAGDSRLYHFRDGRLEFQTKDHSASQIAVALGQITTGQIRFHEDRNRVLKALGQDGKLVPESGGEKLPTGRHAFLLCTDGFWEYVLESEMEEQLRLSLNPKDWLAKLAGLRTARASADSDNNSAAAVWVDIL